MHSFTLSTFALLRFSVTTSFYFPFLCLSNPPVAFVLVQADSANLPTQLSGKFFNSFVLFPVQIPESEDGGSLLGSSKRSLADTSVTSTADLSIFSGGDRRPASQQHERIENDNNNDLTAHENLNYSVTDLNNATACEDDAENGESSPK